MIPFCSTYFAFSDFMKPAIRLAALAGIPAIFVFTHDSIFLGEDGPTHQPVETVSGLRVIPNLDVIRPADPEEVAGAWAAAMLRTDGPTALILTRQGVPNLSSVPIAERREGAALGGYVLRREQGALETIIMASGSEVEHALEAADRLGDR